METNNMEELIPYLVQRASFNEREHKSGIDSILKFDYMGSSEFEWGALPESLVEIRKNINNYTYLDVPIGNKIITVFCDSSQKSKIKQYLSDLVNRKYHLKEFSAFNEYITDDGYFKNKYSKLLD